MNTLDDQHYRLVSYAQNREDLFIAAFFAHKKGFYVDIGSNHPIHHSVTKLLYKKGWHGINVDPNKFLIDLTSWDRPRDIQLHVGVSNKTGSLTFREYENHGLSTFSSDMMREYDKDNSDFTNNYKDYDVNVVTLASIFAEHAPEFTVDLLKVDVEGLEAEVFAGNDWKKYRPTMICVEANHIGDNDWQVDLKKRDYLLLLNDGLNAYYIAKEHENLMHAFDFPAFALNHPHIVDYQINEHMNLLNERLATMRTSHRSDPVHTPTNESLRRNIKASLQELKYLAKKDSQPQVRKPDYDARIVLGKTTDDAVRAYAAASHEMYKKEASHHIAVNATQRKSNTHPVKRRIKKLKLISYHVPRVLSHEAKRAIKRKLR